MNYLLLSGFLHAMTWSDVKQASAVDTCLVNKNSRLESFCKADPYINQAGTTKNIPHHTQTLQQNRNTQLHQPQSTCIPGPPDETAIQFLRDLCI